MALKDFGELNPDGSIKRDVTHSAISGRETQPGDVRIRVKGTPFFYRILASEKRNFNAEARAEFEKQVVQKAEPVAAEAAKPSGKASPEKEK